MDLRTELPRLLPGAISWAETEAARGASAGRSLSAAETALARSVGVSHPERIRLLLVDALPAPSDPVLRAAAVQAGLLDPGMIGLTLGHSVFVRFEHDSTRVLSHEFRHVHQYEQAGSIAAFLPEYVEQVVAVGYRNCRQEVDARAHEVPGGS